jgi:23S rRNA (guanosine2251-2'-O)-methyltransferase
MKIEGRNPILELLKTDKPIDKVLVQENAYLSGSGKQIFAIIKDRKIRYSIVRKEIIDGESEGRNHQGFIAFTEDYRYCGLDELIDYALAKEENPVIVLLDGIEDPHNLGSIIRVCDCGGVSGLIIPRHRSAQVNETVMKVSSGAAEHLKIARETNINSSIEELKRRGFWIYASAGEGGENIYKTDFEGKTALVIGGEGEGIKKLTKEKCDKTVSIPMYGKINSLNAAVACGIFVYEINKQRYGRTL